MDTTTVEFEGCQLTVAAESVEDTRDLQPGDIYVAWGRNTGLHLLTCRSVTWEYRPPPGPVFGSPVQYGWVNPVEPAYAFDLPGCYKVLAIDGEPVPPASTERVSP